MPTQIPIGEGPNSAQLKQTIPYYDKLISMMTIARARPSIPEYPHIAEDIHQALDQVFNGVKEPKPGRRCSKICKGHGMVNYYHHHLC